MLAEVDQTYNSNAASSIHREMEVLLGKKQLCKILIFVETQQTQRGQQTVKEIVLSVVCTEKYRVADVVRDKSKEGLIELPKSQSPDRLLKQADEIKLEMKGSVTLDPDIPEDAYTLTYLEGSDNYVRFPVNIADYNGRMTVILRLGRDNSVLHTFFCTVEEILSLAGWYKNLDITYNNYNLQPSFIQLARNSSHITETILLLDRVWLIYMYRAKCIW